MNQRTTVSTSTPLEVLESLHTMAQRLRRHSLISTSEAGSGHPSTCLSCADLLAVVCFRFLRFDVKSPKRIDNDRLVLSKGHGAPILWAVLAEAGAFPIEELLTLRRIESDLEGHPTPRSPWVDVATGSLGQGLPIGVGMALASKLNGTGNRIYVLQGDGETAEGSVWEAADLAGYRKLDNLTLLLDVNRLGQSQPTMHEHDLGLYARRFEAFGWKARIVDGHNLEEIAGGLEEALQVQGQPTVLVARTLKGKGVSSLEDRGGWHGKPLPKGEELNRALAELGEDLDLKVSLSMAQPEGAAVQEAGGGTIKVSPPTYGPGDEVATRQAYGTALRKVGEADSRVVALDGDTKNSTFSEKFLESYPDRFFECFIAEQNMAGAAVGLSALGKIPFASTFACFWTRAFDFIRMGAISQANVKLCGSHAGVSIGEDGPSQMGLEDLAVMRAVQGSTVFYPSDAVSTERLVALAATTPGIVYIRTSRPKTRVLYSADETFEVGGSKVLRSSAHDRVTLVGAGVTLHEALKAADRLAEQDVLARVIDLYCLKPIDAETLRRAVRETNALVTIEDHYPEGGLGEAVSAVLSGERFKYRRLAVGALPRSGKPEELLRLFRIDAQGIVETVQELLG